MGPQASGYAWHRWAATARFAVRRSLYQPRPLPAGAFEAVIGAAVLDPDVSLNRMLLEPALAIAGTTRVQRTLLAKLAEGTDPERAGAANAWYWSHLPLPVEKFEAWPPAPEPNAGVRAQLHRQWQEQALHAFVATTDMRVRRCLLPGLALRPDAVPPHLRGVAEQVLRIARGHPDAYLRHQVEAQLRTG
ncbi:hypothetical protein BIV57_04235 [Mangrovactinospora gilvigrisea]|uniref:Uncharacterized protein n=1 Tax=Mangrovactinospora gilvigrisea TaxID=1428644 RepID=A0A1J7CB35_9ACTN|nr:hypothetical protein BIV57_04235 [Mangrovactinospora gilvigrisea]